MPTMGQLTQTDRYDIAKAGMLVGPLHLHSFCIPGKILTVAAAKAGTFVTAGAGSNTCKPPTSADEVQVTGLGFLVYDASHGANGTANEYAVGDDANIVSSGPGLWVLAQEDMAFGDPVYVVHASTGRGQVRNDVDTANAAVLYNARCEEFQTINSVRLARISLDRASAVGPTGATGPTGPTA